MHMYDDCPKYVRSYYGALFLALLALIVLATPCLGADVDTTVLAPVVEVKDNVIEQIALDVKMDIGVNILDFGGKVNDEAFDNTSVLQAALDHLEKSGGGVMMIPTGMLFNK